MQIVLSGSVAFDYLMTFPGYFRDHILPDHLEKISLSFLVDSMERRRGGIAPNIAYTLALMGERPLLWATVGEDFEEYRLWLESIGVDTRGARVIPGESTASFFVNTDRSNAQIASFYPGAMAYACRHSLHDLGINPDLVVISPNEPKAMTCYVDECLELGYKYIYDPSQQIVRLTAEELLHGIVSSYALFVNEYEFALIQKMTGLTLAEILSHIHFMVVTQAENGSTIYSGVEVWHIPVVPPADIVDPTGVGDAFRGGFLTGYSHDLDLETCGRMGALAAAYCLEQCGTQTHHFTPAEFVARYRHNFDDIGKLDVLIKE
jgi:adenosine kinase